MKAETENALAYVVFVGTAVVLGGLVVIVIALLERLT